MRVENTWDVLEDLLEEIEYKRDEPPADRFAFERNDEANYAVLYIFTYNKNTYKPEVMRHTRHEFIVPPATYNRHTWARWVFEKIVAIETHETAEWFFVDGERQFAPHHGNGEDPYMVWHLGTDEQARKAPGDD